MATKTTKTHNKPQHQLMLQHEEAGPTTKTDHDRGMFAGLRSRQRDSDEDLEEESLRNLGPDMDRKESSRHFRASSSSVSPSSLQSLTTDSDSLPGEQQTSNGQVSASRNVSSPSPMSPRPEQLQSRNRSPILIKYNYYDYNGERQENHEIGATANHQANSSAQAAKVQRQLSPTFKQSLDQIVRSSQKYLQASQHSSSPISPVHSPIGQQTNLNSNNSNSNSNNNNNNNNNNNDPYTMTLLARRYKLSSYEHRCLRCAKTVYQMDKVGPLKDFTFYHQNCFKCRECGTKLTLKTYFNNQHSSTDQEVYCHRHCPKTPAGRLDNQSVGIRAALNAPKVFDPLLHQQDQVNPMIRSSNLQQQQLSQGQQPQVDSRALHIQHAVKQTKLQAIYKHSQVDKKISQFLNRRLEYLEPKQKMLEMRHREEEEQLFKVFEQKWLQEESSIRDQIRDEWQRELQKLLDKYKRQLSSSAAKSLNLANVNANVNGTGNGNGNGNQAQQLDHELLMKMNQLKSEQQQRLHSMSIQQHQHQHQHQQLQLQLQHAQKTSQHQTPPSTRLDFHRLPTLSQEDSNAEQKMIELERMNLEKTMTIKLDRKKETLKRKLKEFERQATAELVEKQSREMITLISLKLEEFKEEQKRKIGSDLEHFEAIESLANHLGASLQIPSKAGSRQSPRAAPLATNGTPNLLTNGADYSNGNSRKLNGQQEHQQALLAAPPLPEAPQLSKMELYNSDQPDEVFKDIDELAINVAKEDQRTFTDLVHHLTRHCLTDVEKVRAIFRWITVKNLNTMQFDSSVKPDTPLGLLRGIKQGSESYHVLFKRLCSYAGLHCVVIKGYSKSAGYQPGVRFESNRFRNSWNAVYVAGAWRFVQCNWGARHLVSVAVMQDKNSNSSHKSNDVPQVATPQNNGRSGQQLAGLSRVGPKAPSDLTPLPQMANLGRQGLAPGAPLSTGPHAHGILSPASSTCSSSSSYSSGASSSCSSPANASQAVRHSNGHSKHHHNSHSANSNGKSSSSSSSADSLRYEYDDHYFLTDPDEFIYEFFPLAPEWQLLKSRPISLQEFEQLPFVRSLFFKYGLYFPQPDIRSVLYTNSSGATTIKIGMPTHMIPSLIFHYNLKYFDSDVEHHEGVSLKRFVMQSVESGTGGGSANGSSDTNLLSNIVSFRVHVPENGAYILDIFANSTTPNQYITGEPMKFKSVCKFKIIAGQLKTVMVPLPDCASGEYGPMKATRLFGIIPLTHENGLISIQNDKRFLEIQFRMTRPLLDFMASLHKNGQDERQLSKLIKIFIDGDIVFIAIKFHEDGQYGLDIYTRDEQQHSATKSSSHHDTKTNGGDSQKSAEPKKQLLTHCCKYLINVRASK